MKAEYSSPSECGKVDLADDLEAAALAERERRRGPFAHAVHRQHGRPLERRGEEGAGGMAQVMLGEQQLALPIDVVAQRLQLLDQQALLEELLLEPQRQRLAERGEAARREGEIRLQKPLELEERLVVERDEVDFGRPDSGGFEAGANGLVRESRDRASRA